jgi:hypothetical protein
MSKAVHFREEADRARRWAREAVDAEFRKKLLAIAESYDKLAVKAEARDAPKGSDL